MLRCLQQNREHFQFSLRTYKIKLCRTAPFEVNHDLIKFHFNDLLYLPYYNSNWLNKLSKSNYIHIVFYRFLFFFVAAKGKWWRQDSSSRPCDILLLSSPTKLCDTFSFININTTQYRIVKTSEIAYNANDGNFVEIWLFSIIYLNRIFILTAHLVSFLGYASQLVFIRN